MPLKPARTAKFKKDYALVGKRGWDVERLNGVMLKLINQETLRREHRAHTLKGEYKNHRECHISGNFLLIWYETDTEIVFVRTGNHADLFGK